jgi:hypothetical protein
MSSVRAEGELLVVPRGARIPKVCLKCGATRGVVRREQAYAVGALARSFPLAGGAVGAIVANIARNAFRGEPGLQALFLVGVLVVASIFALVVDRTTTKITLALPFCAEHDARLSTALRIRNGVLATAGGAVLLGLAGMGLSLQPLILVAVALVVLAFGVALATKVRRAWVHAPSVSYDAVALRVGADLATSMAQRAQKREAERAAAAEASEDPG